MIEAVLIIIVLYFLYLAYAVHKCGDDPCDFTLDPCIKAIRVVLVGTVVILVIVWVIIRVAAP